MERKKSRLFSFLLSSTALGSQIALTSKPAGTEKPTPRTVGQEGKGA